MSAREPLHMLVDLGLFGKVWPGNRAILGAATCSWMRRDLLSLVTDTIELATPMPGCRVSLTEEDEENIQKTLQRLLHKRVEMRCLGLDLETASRLVDAMRLAMYKGWLGEQLIRFDISSAAGGWKDTRESRRVTQNLSLVLRECKNLTHLDLTGNDMDEDGMRALERVLCECPKLTTLILAENRLGAYGIESVCNVLCACPALATLDVRSSLVHVTHHISSALLECSSLTSLSLGSNPFGNVGLSGVATSLMKNAALNLVHLDLRACRTRPVTLQGTGPTDVRDAWAVVAELLYQQTSLASLNLSGNSMSTDGCIGVLAGARRCCLARLDLRVDGLGDSLRGVTTLAESMSQWPSLGHLDLGECGITDEGARALSAALGVCPAVHTLKLDFNNLSGAGAEHLARAVRGLPCLLHLDVTHNELRDDGAQCLAEALRNCTQLQRLALGWNGIEGEGACALAACRWSRLCELDLSGNSIGAQGAEAVSDLLRCSQGLRLLHLRAAKLGDEGVAMVVEGIAGCESIEELGLGQNGIGPDGATRLAARVGAWASLQWLDLSGNSIGSEGAQVLAGALTGLRLGKLPRLEALDLRNNGVDKEQPGSLQIQTLQAECKLLGCRCLL